MDGIQRTVLDTATSRSKTLAECVWEAAERIERDEVGECTLSLSRWCRCEIFPMGSSCPLMEVSSGERGLWDAPLSIALRGQTWSRTLAYLAPQLSAQQACLQESHCSSLPSNCLMTALRLGVKLQNQASCALPNLEHLQEAAVLAPHLRQACHTH